MSDEMNLARYCIQPRAEDPILAERPAFTFIHDDAEQTWTYREIWTRVQCIGRGLISRGLEPGDRVVLRLSHSPEYAFAFFGAVLAGLVPVPASPQLTDEEASFLVADAEAQALVTEPEMKISGFSGLELMASELDTLDGQGSFPETVAEDPAFLIYTSGTSSRPKGVLHAHRSILGRALMRDGWEGFTPNDATLHAGTLNWSYTLGVGLMDSWAAGAHAMLFGGAYDPAGWMPLIERLAVTVFVAVPTVYRQILKYGRPEDSDLSSLRYGLCAGEPLSRELLSEWRTRVGTDLYEALGMTEVSTYISSGPSTPVRPGSPGRPQSGRQVAILPQDGGTNLLPPGEVGLLAVHGSDPGLMLGYWNRPEEQADVYRGSWFIGGDLAEMDEDGYVWFHGRSDDVIKSFGYRLSPLEIESVLVTCPGVAEVAIVGLDMDETKTLVTACVVPQEQGSVTESALAEYAGEHLAGYKRPHQYRLVDELPRTRNGKLQRRTLLERLLLEVDA